MNDYNAAERRHVREAARASRVADRQRQDVVASIMSLVPGRQWMLELLEGCHLFASSFTGNALETAFAEGERNVGLKLLADIMRVCPQQYILMVQERNERDRANERRRDSSNGASGPGSERDEVDDGSPGDGVVERGEAS
jgi:hypothetical protein